MAAGHYTILSFGQFLLWYHTRSVAGCLPRLPLPQLLSGYFKSFFLLLNS